MDKGLSRFPVIGSFDVNANLSHRKPNKMQREKNWTRARLPFDWCHLSLLWCYCKAVSEKEGIEKKYYRFHSITSQSLIRSNTEQPSKRPHEARLARSTNKSHFVNRKLHAKWFQVHVVENRSASCTSLWPMRPSNESKRVPCLRNRHEWSSKYAKSNRSIEIFGGK